MQQIQNLRLIVSLTVILIIIFFPAQSYGAKLWSTEKSYNSTGYFFGPGAFTKEQKLFAITIDNISFFSKNDFLVPFSNNGPQEPNTCGEREFRGEVDGRFSNGLKINENADMCVATIAGTKLLIGVVEGGPYEGLQYNITTSQGDIVMTMDLALDLGIGERGVITIPFYGTSGEVIVPKSLQSVGGGKGVDQAGIYKSGDVLKGKVGDFNDNGLIDGTLVATGNLPLSSPIYPGQPFAMVRQFETDIPYKGRLYADLQAIKNNKP